MKELFELWKAVKGVSNMAGSKGTSKPAPKKGTRVASVRRPNKSRGK